MKIEKRNINLYDTLFSGQCFRMTKENDGSYTVIIHDRVINIKEENDYLLIDSSNNDNLEEVVVNYLDLNRDYNKINKELSKKSIFKENIKLVDGYRILKQDKFEMYISYIISQNNRVSKIMNSIELLSKKYGKKITYKNKDYYLFPTYEELKDIKVDDLKDIKVGFRDKYIIDALNRLNEDKSFLDRLETMPTEDALKELTKVKGIGTKVASCILLFAYQRFDSYPLDTWARSYISEKYNIKDNLNAIMKTMKEEFGSYSGLAIQYFFHINRNKTN